MRNWREQRQSRRRPPKRIRKAHHLREFIEYGFDVQVWLTPDYMSDNDKLLDWAMWFVDTALRMGLTASGGGKIDGPFEGYVSGGCACVLGRRHRLLRNSVKDETRQVVAKWLTARPEVVSVEVSQLEDAYYSPPVEDFRVLAKQTPILDL